MKKVFTYYSGTGQNPYDDWQLLRLWQLNWAHFGFEPVILNEYIARKHPKYDKFNDRIKSYPTINPVDYERACYIRWLAFAQVNGGVCCDWDLFVYEKPETLNYQTPPKVLQSYQEHVPSLVWGSRYAFEAIIDGIMDYEVGVQDTADFNKPHVSDMYMFYHQSLPYKSKKLVKNFGESGWDTSPFIHFSSGSMKGHLPKHKHIQQLRNWVK